jgi:Protein of unknown function (DUF1552)
MSSSKEAGRPMESTPMKKTSPFNRRAFLRGAGGAIAIGLPFIEGLSHRSAWAADDVPVFGFFLIAANGVVPGTFWPGATGALSEASFSGKSTAPLAPFASNLVLVKGTRFPGGLTSCGHAQGLAQSLTGKPNQGSGNSSTGAGISADMAIAQAVNGGKEPLTLYSGKKNYIGERISFAGAGNARAAQVNPYATYQSLVGLVGATPTDTGSTPAPTTPAMTDELLVRRKSVNDLVRDELMNIKGLSGLSADDVRRIDQHMEAVLQIELNMMNAGMNMPGSGGAGCTEGTINKTGLEAFKNGINFSQNGNMIEDLVKLHFETVALAFACNANRVATLQWGDGTDGTKYSGISGPGWPFHQVSHRIQSDGASGAPGSADYTACEKAHTEVDTIRMNTLAYGLKQFEDRGLFSNSFVYWSNHCATGPDHSFNNLPVIIAGNAGGRLKQGVYVDANNATNDKTLSTLIEAAGASAAGFGSGGGATLAAIEV